MYPMNYFVRVFIFFSCVVVHLRAMDKVHSAIDSEDFYKAQSLLTKNNYTSTEYSQLFHRVCSTILSGFWPQAKTIYLGQKHSANKNNTNFNLLPKDIINLILNLAHPENSQQQLIDYVLKKGAKINHENHLKITALLLASRFGTPRLVQYLLKKGASINHQAESGASPIEFACINNKLGIVKVLIDNKAQVNIFDKNKFSPLFYACRNGNLELVKLLVENDAKINHQNRCGETPLFEACKGHNPLVIDYLISHNAEVNHICRHDDSTPIFISCDVGDWATFELLVTKGASINHKNCHNDTPLLYALKKNTYYSMKSSEDKIKIAQYLIQNGADISCIKNKEDVERAKKIREKLKK